MTCLRPVPFVISAITLTVLLFALWKEVPVSNDSAQPVDKTAFSQRLADSEITRKDRFDQRQAEPHTPAPEQQSDANRLAARVPGVSVSFDPTSGSPSFVASPASFLTGRGGRGIGIPESATVRNDGPSIVRAFIDEYPQLHGHDSQLLNQATASRDYVTAHNGVRTMVWQQEYNGLRIFGAQYMAHVTRHGELINVASLLVPAPEAAVSRGSSALSSEVISVNDAVVLVSHSLGGILQSGAVSLKAPEEAGARILHLEARPEFSDLRAEKVWLPDTGNSLRLCWEVNGYSVRNGMYYRTLVDATTGELKVRHCLTEAAGTAATYRVFTGGSAQPMRPSLTSPAVTEPPVVAGELLTLASLSELASPNGWMTAGVNETRGNNVDAHLDTNADNVADTPRPQGSPLRIFDSAFNPVLPPSSNSAAGVVNLFYWCNAAHDLLYDYGFTEAAGNFQINNFGRGGQGNDAVQADAQDGRGTNNAYFTTPADGQPGRMEMLNFTGPHPDRDSALDAEIILHEYTHGLTNRLVGGGAGITANIPRGMGEGWSDFYALCLLSRPGQPADAPHAFGSYTAKLRGSGFLNQHYFGIRRYPYSTDQRKNPLNFGDVSNFYSQSYTAPRNPTVTNTPEGTHNMGEFWCSVLWDARAHLIARYGETAGNDLMLRLVTDGLKLAPANPNWIQARNAILQADLAYTGGANHGELWTAFATRGLGSNASATDTTNNNGVLPGYDIPVSFRVQPSGEWQPSMAETAIPEGTASYTLRNTGSEPMNWVAAPFDPWLTVTPASGNLAPASAVTITVALNTAASRLPAGEHAGRIEFKDLATGYRQPRVVRLNVNSPGITLFEETWESGTISPAWTISGTASHRTQVTWQNLPASGSWHLTMDASASVASRNEATLSLDLTGRQDVYFSFQCKSFGDEPHGPPPVNFSGGADFDGVAISADGGNTWHEVQPLRDFSTSYQPVLVSLDAAMAARGLSFGPDFKIRFTHFDDGQISSDGIALDNIRLYQWSPARLQLELPSETTEGGASFSATVTAIPAPSVPLTVSLALTGAAQLSIPSTVTIPAGLSAATFEASPLDDILPDGSQPARVIATATGYALATDMMTVHDNESAVLSLSIPTISEGQPAQTGTVTMSVAAPFAVAVNLSTDLPSALNLPAAVLIPAGQTSAVFAVSSTENSVIHFTRNAAVTASVTNWQAATTIVTVLDNESTAMTLNIPATLREGQSGSGSIQFSGTLAEATTVTLAADVPELIFTNGSQQISEITLSAGQSSSSFIVRPVDDLLRDGSVSVTISAAAAGYTSTPVLRTVHDNDAGSLQITPIPSPRIANAPITLTVVAYDIHGVHIPNYWRALSLSATADGLPLPVSSGSLSAWTLNGILNTTVSVPVVAQNIQLVLDDQNGVTSGSNLFDTVIGPPFQILWGAIPSPQRPDTPFQAQLRVADEGGNTVTAFNGTASLVSWIGSATGPPITPQEPVTFVSGLWSGAVSVPFTSNSMRLRATGTGFSGLSESFAVSVAPQPANTAAFTLAAPSFLHEGGTPQPVVLTLPTAAATDLLFTLTTSAPGKISLPASVTVPAGQTGTTFEISPLDDAWSDGDKSSYLSATQQDTGLSAYASVTVLDNEITGFQCDFPAAVTEGGSAVTGTITLSSAPAFGSVTVQLAASNSAQLLVPATVTVPAGQTTASFTVSAVNDVLIDGPVSVNVTVSRSGYASVLRTVQVNDNESRNVTFVTSGILRIDEGASITVPIRTYGTLTEPLTVGISSSNPARLLPPASIVLPAGSSSVDMQLTAPENSTAEEAANITLTITPSPGFTGESKSWTVHENDPAAFSIIAHGTRTKGIPANQILWARTPSGQTAFGFHASASLSAAGDTGPVPLTPQTTSAFTSGQWTGPLTYLASGKNVRLTVTRAGVSTVGPLFEVLGGTVARFDIALPPGPLTAGNDIPVTITPYDADGAVTNNTDGVTVGVTSPFNEYSGPDVQPSNLTVQGSRLRSRTICLYTPEEVGGPQRLTGVALRFATYPSGGLRAWSLRLKHSPQPAETPVWDNSGWSAPSTVSPPPGTGWLQTNLAAPFYYNGTDNLLVEFSFDNGTQTRSNGEIFCRPVAGRTLTAGSGYQMSPAPFDWPSTASGASPEPAPVDLLPAIRFHTGLPLNPFTVSALNFSNGPWSGIVNFFLPGRNTRLEVSGYYNTQSPPFDILPAVAGRLAVTVEQTGTTTVPRGTLPSLPRIWRVFNQGGAPLTWTASSNAAWGLLDQTGGVLGPQQSTLVSLIPQQSAATLPAGTYASGTLFESVPAFVSYGFPSHLTVSSGGILTLPPSPVDVFAGPAGGPFVHQSAGGHSWMPGNSGDAPMNWSADPGAGWLMLSPAAGTLAAGTSTMVTASVSGESLWPGTYATTSTFANTSTGAGGATGDTLLHAAPAAALSAIPAYSSNPLPALSTRRTGPLMEYEFQSDLTADFTAPQSSGWQTGNTWLASGDTEGTTRHYRVRARTSRSLGLWSQTTPATLAASRASGVVSTDQGFTLENPPSGRFAAAIINPDFSQGVSFAPSPQDPIAGWTRDYNTPGLPSAVLAPTGDVQLYGTEALRLFVDLPPEAELHSGDYSQVYQRIDFKGADSLVFDAGLSSQWPASLAAVIRIDGVPVWSRYAAGVWRNETIPLHTWQGDHTLELRIECLNGGSFSPHSFYIDQLRLTAPPGLIPAGSLTSPEINSPQPGQWNQLFMEATTPSGTAVTAELIANGVVVASGLTSGTDLSLLPQLQSLSKLQVRARLTTEHATVSPVLHAWGLSWLTSTPGPVLSGPWSPPVSSTLDTSPPQCAITSPDQSSGAVHTITGTATDLSGISLLHINGNAVATTNDHSTWSHSIVLAPGANTFTLTAADNAVPPNVFTQSFNVMHGADADGDRLPDEWELAAGLNPALAAGADGTQGDPDGDGLTNFIELALGLSPSLHDTGAAPRIEFRSGPGGPQLVLIYRRRITPGFTFQPQFSTSLSQWMPAAGEEMSVSPNGDALTETVELRLPSEAMDSTIPRRFLRIHVTAP